MGSIEDLECPICNELLNINFLSTSCCNQKLHTDCYNKALISTKGTCPFCRHAIIIVINENPVYNNQINNTNLVNTNQVVNSYKFCSNTANFLFCSCYILFFTFFFIFFNRMIFNNNNNTNNTNWNNTNNSTKFNST